MHLPLFVGKISYVLGYPFIRLWLWKSHRVYILIVVDNNILVSKNWLGLHKRWRLPGGGAHKGEDEQAALMREVYEELGIQLDTSLLLKLTTEPIHSKKGYTYSVYLTQLSHMPALQVNEAEIVAWAWIQCDTLKNTAISSELALALRLVARHEIVL